MKQAALALLGLGLGLGLGTAHADTDPQSAIRLDDRIGTRLPLDLGFVDSTGAPTSLAHYLAPHRPLVLVLAYAHCRMLCNVVLRGLGDAIRASALRAGRDYQPIVVTLDPGETPDEAARRQDTLLAAADLHERAAWPYLTGPHVAMLADALGFHYAWDPHTEQYAHPAVVFVVAPDGRLAADLRGIAYDGLDAAVTRAARGELAGPDSTDILRCFHFDPAQRRYQARLSRFFRLGAGAVFTALAIVLAALLRAELRRRRR